MRAFFRLFIVLFSFVVLFSCSSKALTTLATGVDISKYKYITYGELNRDGDAELADIIMMVQNELSNKFVVLSPSSALDKIRTGEHVLTPRINVKTEKWDGGHTYITISFFDFATDQSIAVVKSSGIGMSISQDQRLAFSALRKELNRVFR